MAKQTTTTATQSLKKAPPSRSATDAAASASRRRKPAVEKQPKTRKSAPKEERVAAAADSPAPKKRPTKQDQLAALVLRDEGATIPQMIDATGWLPHTVRAALTGLKKKGYAIDSDKVGEVRTYRATSPQ